MKNLLLFAFALLGTLLTARAQTPAAEWATACAGGPVDTSYGAPYYFFGPTGLTTDPQGNSYVLGKFRDVVTIGSVTLQATQVYSGYNGPGDYYLAKFTPQGQVQWAIQLGDGQVVVGAFLAADNSGNLYLTGSFTSYSMQVGAGGPILYNSSADTEGFVARFSGQTGQCQWARRFGGTGFDSGGSLAITPAGELYLIGRTGDASADLGPFILPAAPSYSSKQFMAKLSASGTWIWVQQLGFSISSLLPDGNNSFYVVGSFASPGIVLGNTTLTINALSGGSAGYDLLVAKYSATGALRWARQTNPGGSHSLGGSGLYDGQGHLYITGSFSSQTARVGSFLLSNAGPLVPPPLGPAPPTPNSDRYYSDAFVARYDTAGTWQWARRYGSASANDYIRGAALDGAGQLWANLLPDGSASELHVLDGSSGTITHLFSPPSPPTGGSVPFLLTGDQLGRIYLAGRFTGSTLSLGTASVPGAGNNYSTGYVARLGSLPLAAQLAATTNPGLQAWPSPGPGTGVWVQGAPAGQTVAVFDVLGRQVGGGAMPTSGPLRLSWAGAGLAPGVYVVRSGGQSGRWVVEN